MAEEKRRVEISFSEAEFAILEELSQGSLWSVEKIIYDTIFHAHFTAEAKKRHEAGRRLMSREPIDWGADWAELKEWMAKHRAWETLKSMGQDEEPS